MSPLFLQLIGCAIHLGPTQEHTDVFDVSEPITAVVLNGTSGEVVVHGGYETVRVERYAEWSGDTPQVDAYVQDGVLYLDDGCSGWGWCRVDHEIQVPAATDIEIHVGSGDLDVHGVSGWSFLETGSGDVIIADLSGDAAVSVGSGDIEGSALSLGSLECETGSGDVEISYRLAPALTSIYTGSGDVELSVPAAEYRVELETGSGDVEIEGIQEDPGADRLLRISTGSGDIQLHGH